MLNDVDIYAPFRDGDGKKPGMLAVDLNMQTSFGFVYSIKIPCKPSVKNPLKPDPVDFAKKYREFSKRFDPDQAAMRMYKGMHGKIRLAKLLEVANKIHAILKKIKPAQLLLLMEHGGNNGKGGSEQDGT